VRSTENAMGCGAGALEAEPRAGNEVRCGAESRKRTFPESGAGAGAEAEVRGESDGDSDGDGACGCDAPSVLSGHGGPVLVGAILTASVCTDDGGVEEDEGGRAHDKEGACSAIDESNRASYKEMSSPVYENVSE
jgi:hypothetical protein